MHKQGLKSKQYIVLIYIPPYVGTSHTYHLITKKKNDYLIKYENNEK